MRDLRTAASSIMQAALDAADPAACVSRAMAVLQPELLTARRIVVVGAGKAAAPMAQAVEQTLPGRIAAGWVNTKYGHSVLSDQTSLRVVVCHESGHPVPDQAGVTGSLRIAELAVAAEETDLLLCLISGGASALMPLPAGNVTLAEKQATTQLLLASGATIHEINTVRKHLSLIKGGRLVRLAYPARIISLILSDVIGDDLDVIGSGPTAPDASTFEDAREVLHHRGIWDSLPESVRLHMTEASDESPKPGDALFARVQNIVVGSNRQALEAARLKAVELGFRTLLLASSVQGESRDVAGVHAAILRELVQSGNPVPRPACILSGGETTVTLWGQTGKGGRNQEFALAAAIGLEGLDAVLCLSFGTDGTDGPTDAAGAFADGKTVKRARLAGLDPALHLRNHDAYPFFAALGDLLITGPTRTNVMDVNILLAG